MQFTVLIMTQAAKETLPLVKINTGERANKVPGMWRFAEKYNVLKKGLTMAENCFKDDRSGNLHT